MSALDQIAHLDWTPNPGTGLRDEALQAFEDRKGVIIHDLLTRAQRLLKDILNVDNALNVQVKPKNFKDGDGEVFCEVDGMQFRIAIVYPTGGGEEPSTQVLAVKTGNNYAPVDNMVTLGRLLFGNSVTVKEDEDEPCTD